jgi:hypothetical protein
MKSIATHRMEAWTSADALLSRTVVVKDLFLFELNLI